MSINEIILQEPITFILDADLGSDVTSPNMLVGKFQTYSIGIVFTYAGLEDSAGDMSLETSDDGVNFKKMDGSDIAYTAASTYERYEMTLVAHKYFRVVMVNSSGTGGTVTMKLFGRS